MRNTTNRPLYKDPTTKVDCPRRQDGEQQPGKAVALYEKLKDRVEESRGGKRNGPITDASLDDGQTII